MSVHKRAYIERTIMTIRNHRDAENCWPQWANILADEKRYEVVALIGPCLREEAESFLDEVASADPGDLGS